MDGSSPRSQHHWMYGVFGVTSPATWISLFTNVAEVHRLGASYLVISSLAYPFLGLGLTLASAFQAAGRPAWPVLAITSRALVVAVGGWIAVHLTEAGIAGLAVVAASGLICLWHQSDDRVPGWPLENSGIQQAKLGAAKIEYDPCLGIPVNEATFRKVQP